MADIRTWSCEIGVVPDQMIPDGGDAPFRCAVENAWEKMFPGIPCSISSGWGPVTPALPQHSVQNEAYLGLATTEELLRELIARFSLNHNAVILAEMVGGLSMTEKEYRTVDS